jgi:hypothetical protein
MQLGHRLNVAVALFTGEPPGNVRIMIEVDEVGEVVDPEPGDRFLFLECAAEPYDLGLVGSDEFVASHAEALGRNSRRCRAAHTAMAILTGDLVLPGVNLVAECDRLTGT